VAFCKGVEGCAGAGATKEGTPLGIVTTSSDTAYTHTPEVIYDFVTNPANWTKTYPGNIDRYHAAVARELDAQRVTA
jgi:hypothetical protein